MPAKDNSRKRKRGNKGKESLRDSELWQSVDVDGGQNASEDVEENNSNNHYDNPKLQKAANVDLQAQPGEDVAMFFGLEVLDGSQYQVVGDGNSKRLVIGGEQPPVDKDPGQEDVIDETKAKKSKKKKKEKKTKSTDDDAGESDVAASKSTPQHHDAPDEEAPALVVPSANIDEIQFNWNRATGGISFHPKLYTALAKQGFSAPTPIQAATLSASTMGRRNLVGTAPTGSGKTLAFLLPIVQSLLETRALDDDSQKFLPGQPVHSLIIAPTRELAIQIHAQCDKLFEGLCVSLVGGIAIVKQKRLLETKRPPIIIGTPGRLWAMISSGEYSHLNDFSKVHFLVLDEADRLAQDHSFPQLLQILDYVHQANPGNAEEEDEESDDEDDESSQDRLLSLPGVKGEASLTMLTPDILAKIEASRAEPAQRQESDDDDDMEDGAGEDDYPDLEWDQPSHVHRQTFVFSATLSLPHSSTKSKKENSKADQSEGIAEILKKCHVMGETKMVDLSLKQDKSGTSTSSGPAGVSLPPGLTLEQIKCTQRHKDSHLYAYLMTTAQGASGPCLVFCNSIAGVRRVGATLQTLGFSVRILHSHMQQRARFKAVESLDDSKSRAVVVCTDVAARGLDIPSVSTVVHYDVARTVDTFVHRAGRTARGMGEGAVGSSLSLISSAEDKAHSKIVDSLKVTFSKILLDGRLLSDAQERTNLATKVVANVDAERKTQSSMQWFKEKADEAELELDTEILESANDLTEKEQVQKLEAKRARAKLAELLTQPMQTQRFGKFLSTNPQFKQGGSVAPIVEKLAPNVKASQPKASKKRKVKK
eukprot:Nitzschia sp. Nitz4//scaffold357_size15932//7551//10647//NITZ4_008875-RA/size15932-processed-gene-0.27-mRNA-1//1//CDS//3329548983//4934//frame0